MLQELLYDSRYFITINLPSNRRSFRKYSHLILIVWSLVTSPHFLCLLVIVVENCDKGVLWKQQPLGENSKYKLGLGEKRIKRHNSRLMGSLSMDEKMVLWSLSKKSQTRIVGFQVVPEGHVITCKKKSFKHKYLMCLDFVGWNPVFRIQSEYPSWLRVVGCSSW